MELTYENVIAVVKELNEKYPNRGTSKHEIALYFDTEEDKLKRLRIEVSVSSPLWTALTTWL